MPTERRLLGFVSRQTVWLPTVRGWLAIVLLILVALFTAVRTLYIYLAPNRPTGVGVLVVEGWMDPPELDQAIEMFNSGAYDAVVTTGGPLPPWPGSSSYASFAERAAAYLKQNGLENDVVFVISTSAVNWDRTYSSAVEVRRWAARSKVTMGTFDVVSRGPHARRSWELYRLAFGEESRIGVRAADPSDYDSNAWWRTSAGVKAVLVEAIALAWVKCCFWPS